MHSRDVAIVIPVYKPEPSSSEILSLKRCAAILGNYDAHLVVPDNMPVKSYTGVHTKLIISEFDREYFSSIAGYNRLMVQASFYERFKNYKYILIYQLDAYVFRDELLDWCRKGFSYIGSPWFKDFSTSLDTSELWTVGNGGFSLRNVDHHLAVLRSKRKVLRPRDVFQLYKNYPTTAKLLRLPKILLRCAGWKNDALHIPQIFEENEDRLWSFYAKNLYPKFKVAQLEEALKFSFECNPARMYELNDRQLPFGCHAWEKYDPDFWKSILETHS